MFRIVALCLLLVAGAIQTAAAAQSAKLEELEEVRVIGRQPGPPLWKISNGENVLWILPLVEFLPQDLEWDSARVQRLIAGSQEYLLEPTVSTGFSLASINPLSASRVLGILHDMTYLPRGKRLKDVLPPAVYERYLAIRSRFFPRHSTIATMTLPAAQAEMMKSVLERMKLERPFATKQKIRGWVRAAKVRMSGSSHETVHSASTAELKAFRKLIDEAQRSESFQTLQVACFDKVISFYENDLEPAKQRAIAWAQGRADNLVSSATAYPAECSEPWEDMQHSPAGRRLAGKYPKLAEALYIDRVALRTEARQRWLAAAERALERNTSTFGELMVNDMLGPDGLVTQLQAKGYKVEISAAD